MYIIEEEIVKSMVKFFEMLWIPHPVIWFLPKLCQVYEDRAIYSNWKYKSYKVQ